MKKIGWALVGVIVAVAAGFAWAQSVPQLINYQGRLTNAAGQPPADGATVDLRFVFYGVASGGMPYLTVLQEDVVVTGGIYNVLIGSGTVTPGTETSLAAVFQKHAEVWMGVKVNADAEMTPRAGITSVPYALSLDQSFLANFLGEFTSQPDWDGDGYQKTGTPADCNDWKAAINPGAPEICTDGIDNDCDAKIDGADHDGVEACSDALDNDCDGLIDGNDPDCQGGGSVGPMALIPSGCFDMGDAFSEGYADQLPVHNVCFTSDFYMDTHEVTNAEYLACYVAAACTLPSDYSSYSRGSYFGNPTFDRFPVIYIRWDQAKDYCTWAAKRLPSEAEWEYAARGGLAGKRYPWGDTVIGTDSNFWNSGDAWDNDTSPLGNYAANGYGLYDMAGNVYEWVNDWYLDTYYATSPANDPPGPASGTLRIYRGGGWSNTPDYQRVAWRFSGDPSDSSLGLGFRCARD